MYLIASNCLLTLCNIVRIHTSNQKQLKANADVTASVVATSRLKPEHPHKHPPTHHCAGKRKNADASSLPCWSVHCRKFQEYQATMSQSQRVAWTPRRSNHELNNQVHQNEQAYKGIRHKIREPRTKET